MSGQFSTFPVLQTPRLTLIQITGNHSDDLFELFGNKKVAKYLYNDVETKEQAAESIEVFDNWYEEGSGIRWGITLKRNPKLIGTVYITFYKQGGTGNFGYDLNEEFWGQGIATEAAKAVSDFAFKTLKLAALSARTGTENPSSQRVLEKSGFIRKKILEEKEFWNGEYHEQILYLKKSGE